MKYHPDFIRLAEAMFSNITLTIEDLEARYPNRNLDEHAEVTRFAPSPTGFLHTGSLFASLIAKKIAHQSGGVFFVRLEDTDSKREIVGSDMALIEQMKAFNVAPDEGFGADTEGNYGPYRQSQRAEIYHAVAKTLVAQGDAYPCFATAAELDEMRRIQEARNVVTGYYGPYAKYRDYPVDKAIADIEAGRPFVVRFKSQGRAERYINIVDEIRGQKPLTENYWDEVMLKSDGLPTYHFAHVVDDHFMRTTVVTRGEEWLPSLPKHLEMFARLGWTPPRFAHLPVINKLDEGKRRKLSKRKDSEAAVSFFLEHGYPVAAVIEYLMTIANSNFEEWRMANKTASIDEFSLSFSKMSVDGALFDMQKIISISKEIIAEQKAVDLVKEIKHYAKRYHAGLTDLINRDEMYFQKIVNIEREKENPRKDFLNYESVFGLVKYFYRDYYETSFDVATFNPSIPLKSIKDLLGVLNQRMELLEDEASWFAHFKQLVEPLGFAPSNKIFKQNSGSFVGHIGDAAEILRIALTGLKQTPNLFQMMQVLGIDEIHWRVMFVIEKLHQ
jgi:glutamyl-tRNA synthetase